jgi:N6-adenosine-specific RNA methylase IME4
MNDSAQILSFSPSCTIEQWEAEGRDLGELERRGHSLMWDIGDWWNRCPRGGDRVKTVKAEAWTGPAYGTARVAGAVAGRWPVLLRNNTLGYEHHRLVAALPDEQAIPLLQWCAATEPPRSTQQLFIRKQQIHRANREAALAETIAQAAQEVGRELYGVLYADPPWRMEPYSRETGLNRAADNHYPTMTSEQLLDMKIMRTAPAKDCVLFCWATVPMLEDALEWMAEYGFAYRSHCVWTKDRIGTGFWFRNQHELLLVGVRGTVPAPAPGTQFSSVIQAPVGKHSKKPDVVYEMIETMFPNTSKLELFARAARTGWEMWGAEARWAL